MPQEVAEKKLVAEMTCISCPVGCALQVYDEYGKIAVYGNTCKRGEAYGISEYTDPVRVVTSLMRREHGGRPATVKTSAPVPKAAIPGVLAALSAVCAPDSVCRGQVLIANVCGTGADIVATSDIS